MPVKLFHHAPQGSSHYARPTYSPCIIVNKVFHLQFEKYMIDDVIYKIDCQKKFWFTHIRSVNIFPHFCLNPNLFLVLSQYWSQLQFPNLLLRGQKKDVPDHNDWTWATFKTYYVYQNKVYIPVELESNFV